MYTIEDNNIFRAIEKKIWGMYRKQSHTLGEVLILYLIIFLGLLMVLLVAELAFR